jgi:hypothetical protein
MVSCLFPQAVLERLLPVLTSTRAGQIRFGLGRSNANIWADLNNNPSSPSQRQDELRFQLHHSRTIPMSDNTKANIATADALTLLLHNQHAICAAIEELTKWLADNGVGNVAVNAMAAMQTLDMNAQGITDAIMRLRHS